MMDTRKAQLDREWEPLTEEHEYQLKRILGGGSGYEDSDTIGTFTAFENGETVDPLAIVGAYRSGKTQLLYYLFNKAWDRRIPAFYVGDPGSMLIDFQESEAEELDQWIQQRIDEQLTAYHEDDVDAIEWFPNVDSETKQSFVAEHGNFDADGETVKTTLLFDEVEQSYRNFIQTMDKDDDNPLRKINDSLQDSVKIWSFGMISAFEFIGEADWGRMKEIRIPPVNVSDVRGILADRRPEVTDLANVIWWLARGRTGLIIKLIDDLPADIEQDATKWLKNQAEADFKDTRLVNNLWAELDYEEWELAINTLLFREDGLDEWQINDTAAIDVDACVSVAVDIIKDEHDFPDTDRGNDARSVLARNIERVFQGLAVSEEAHFPQYGLSQPLRATAFLDLVENTVVSYEPASHTRRLVINALDSAESNFGTQWIQKVNGKEAVDTSVTTANPVKVRDAFPPIAVNPERVADAGSDNLRGEMDRGLEFKTGNPIDDTVSVQFCPTETTVTTQVSELVRGYDITNPTLIIAPEDDEFELDDDAKTYQRQNLLEIKRIQSNRLWSFVLNMYGRLEVENFDDPYFVDDSVKSGLLNEIEDREVRNTVETLYEQLNKVALDEAKDFADQYRSTYSLPNSDTLLWDEERLSGSTAYWSNGQFDEATIALSYLPVFGPDYEPNQQYTKLHDYLHTAISDSLVSGGANGFGFTEYFDNMFSKSGYSSPVSTERSHYRSGGNLAPAIMQTEQTLTDFADILDASSVISELDDPDNDAAAGDIAAISINGMQRLAYPFFRALLICGLTKGSDPPLDVPARLRQVKGQLETQLTTVRDYRKSINSLNKKLESPESVDVGTWIEVRSDRLSQYEDNLKNITESTDDLIQKCENDPSAGPIGYHYLFLLREYFKDISDQIHGFDSDVSAAEVTEISNARRLFNDVYEKASSSEVIAPYFESSDKLCDSIEAFGEEVFNLEAHHGATTVSLPEDLEDLRSLDRTVGEYTDTLYQMRENLKTIEEAAENLEPQLEQCRKQIAELLQPAEVTSND
jgi:hypothetical protein